MRPARSAASQGGGRLSAPAQNELLAIEYSEMSSATTMAEQRRRCRQMLRPAPQQDDVDDDAEQCAEIRKHNAGADCTRHPENCGLDDRHCRCADSVRGQHRARTRRWRSTRNSCAKRPIAPSCACCSSRRRATAVCIDPLALPDLAPLAPLLTARRHGEGHACRAPGPRSAAARGRTGAAGVRHADRRGAGRISRADRLRRAGAPAARRRARQGAHAHRLGAAPAVRRSSRNTRSTTCVTCSPLRASLLETLAAKGRLAWLEEELGGAGQCRRACASRRRRPGKRSRDCRRSTRRASGWRRRSPPGASGARSNATGRAAGSSTTLSLREIVLRLPRSLEALGALAEMQESVVRKCGEELLALVREAGIADPPPPLPRRERPDPAQLATVKRLADIAGGGGRANSRSAPKSSPRAASSRSSPPADRTSACCAAGAPTCSERSCCQRFDLRRARRGLRATLRASLARDLARGCTSLARRAARCAPTSSPCAPACGAPACGRGVFAALARRLRAAADFFVAAGAAPAAAPERAEQPLRDFLRARLRRRPCATGRHPSSKTTPGACSLRTRAGAPSRSLPRRPCAGTAGARLLPGTQSTAGTAGGALKMLNTLLHSEQVRAAGDAAHQLLGAHVEQHHGIDGRAELAHQRREGFGLRLGARESVEDESRPARRAARRDRG